jgi:hypothetical protein
MKRIGWNSYSFDEEEDDPKRLVGGCARIKRGDGEDGNSYG